MGLRFTAAPAVKLPNPVPHDRPTGPPRRADRAIRRTPARKHAARRCRSDSNNPKVIERYRSGRSCPNDTDNQGEATAVTAYAIARVQSGHTRAADYRISQTHRRDARALRRRIPRSRRRSRSTRGRLSRRPDRHSLSRSPKSSELVWVTGVPRDRFTSNRQHRGLGRPHRGRPDRPPSDGPVARLPIGAVSMMTDVRRRAQMVGLEVWDEDSRGARGAGSSRRARAVARGSRRGLGSTGAQSPARQAPGTCEPVRPTTRQPQPKSTPQRLATRRREHETDAAAVDLPPVLREAELPVPMRLRGGERLTN